MDKTQEALKMAIVAMDTWKDIDVLKARKMCKEALAQPAQEPIKDHCVHLGIDICKNKGVCKYCSPPKIDLPRLNHYNADFTRCGIQHKGKMYLFVADTHPAPAIEQEPVAFTNSDELSELQSGMTTCYMYKQAINDDDIALYTHPAPSWQGLSDNEIKRKSWDNTQSDGFYDGAKWAEQALNEKNT